MRAYVVHYSKNHQRRLDLEADPRFHALSDVTWIDWYDREEPECEWVQKLCRSTLDKSVVSNNLKHFEALRLFVESDATEMVLLEDDVVFQGGWLEKLQKVLDKSPDIQFLRLDCVTHIKYDGEIKVVTDWWPSEAQYMKKEFAQILLSQVTFNQPYDNFVYSLMAKHSLPMLLLPVCNQTSLLTHETSISGKVDDVPEFYRYDDLRSKLAALKVKKYETEQKFLEKYGRRIQIRSMSYLEENDLD